MNEKGLQILEQYDIQLQRSFGGRGSLMLETDQGLKLLKEFAGSRHKLPLEQRILKRLEEQGICRTDRAVANREGELISIGEYETPYILKNWPPGRECDPRNEEDLLRSMRTLARIHRELRGMPGLSGDETLQQMAALHKNLPVILLTGQAGVEESFAKIEAANCACLTKPVALNQLLEKIGELLQGTQHSVGGDNA